MKEILSFIFDRLTDPLGLPISPLWEYLILLVIGEIAFRIAWEASPGGLGGSIIHWIVRAITYIVIWAIVYAVIWTGKFIIAHWIPFACAAAGMLIIGTIVAVAKSRKGYSTT